jgi:alpha-glucosidase
VDAQRSDPTSVLILTRDLIALRRDEADLHGGDYRSLDAPEGVWAWSRGRRHFVAINMGDEPVALPGLHGTLRIGTGSRRAGEAVEGSLQLAPWEGVIGASATPTSTAR